MFQLISMDGEHIDFEDFQKEIYEKICELEEYQLENSIKNEINNFDYEDDGLPFI